MLIGMAVQFATVPGIEGPLFPHLIAPAFAWPVLLLVLVVAGAFHFLPDASDRWTAVATGGSTLAAIGIVSQSLMMGADTCKEWELGRALLAGVKSETTDVLRINFDNKRRYGPAATLALLLYREHRAFCVENRWAYIFGRNFACKHIDFENTSATSVLITEKRSAPDQTRRVIDAGTVRMELQVN
jgi:hypothetical protein